MGKWYRVQKRLGSCFRCRHDRWKRRNCRTRFSTSRFTAFSSFVPSNSRREITYRSDGTKFISILTVLQNIKFNATSAYQARPLPNVLQLRFAAPFATNRLFRLENTIAFKRRCPKSHLNHYNKNIEILEKKLTRCEFGAKHVPLLAAPHAPYRSHKLIHKAVHVAIPPEKGDEEGCIITSLTFR